MTTQEEMNEKYMDKVYTMDMSSNTDEIVEFPMMGTSDEMKDLLSKGSFKSYKNIVYLAGGCNVGKSTLADILIGEKIPKKWITTDTLNIYFGRNGINLKTREMVPLHLRPGSDGDVLSRVLCGQPDMTQAKPDTTPQRKDITLSTSAAPNPTLVPGTGNDDVNITDPLRQQSVQHSIIANIQEKIRKGTYKIEIAPSDLVNFGGQRSFDVTHQLFMGHKGTFVLMFNGNIDLNNDEQEETIESILKHCVNSILSFCADDEDIVPMIMFCATHSDCFNQEDLIHRKAELIHDLREIFKNHKQQYRIIYDDIFFINGKDKSDSEISRLKSKLVEVAFQQKSWGKRMPMAWVPLDLQMSEMRLHNVIIISKVELTTLNQGNEDLALTVEQIKYFLNDQHSLGKILYFDQHGLDNFIIVQPQSLVHILRSFITDENSWPKDKELKNILETLMKTGQILKANLFKLWSQEKFHQHMPNDDFKEFIIQVLVHLDILVELKHYRQEQESTDHSYIVPCMVKCTLPDDLYVKSAEQTICLSYTLLKSSIPAALSFKLIGAAFNLWPLQKTKSGGICLYQQAAIFCIDISNELLLQVKDDKVFVYLTNKSTKRDISPNIASTVQECLTLTMTKVLEFYHKSFGKSLSTSEVSKVFELEVGEWCTTGEGCYISVPEVKEKTEWLCRNNRTHKTKYPHYWVFEKQPESTIYSINDFVQFPMMGNSEEMKELLLKGTFISYENCVYLAGACNVGKSTLASILIGEEIPQHWNSTDGLTIYFGRNGIDLKNKKMVTLNQDYDGDCLSKVLRGKPDMTEENPDTNREEVKPDTNLSKNREEVKPDTNLSKNREEVKPDTNLSKNREEVKPDTNLSKNREEVKPDTNLSKNREEVKPDTNLSKNREEMKPDTTLSKNREEVLPHDSNKGNIIPETHTIPQRKDITLSTSAVPGTGNDDVNIPDTLGQQSVHNSILTAIQDKIRKGTYKIEIAPSDLVDFGGQRSFDMTHQLFMRHKGTFVLMFNGKIGFFDHLEEYKQEETTASILKHWVNSILSYCADDEDTLPKIMFCATHSDYYDIPEDREVRKKKLIDYLRKIFEGHKQKSHIIYDDIFFIDGRVIDDPEIKKLKSKLVEVAFESWDKQDKRMPMAWVPLELQMSELRLHNNMNIISKEELRTLNQRNGDLALTVKQIERFLNVQHSLGKILYFDQHGLDNFIVVQPQSLVDILRSFITDELFWAKDEKLSDILCTLTNTGIIAKPDLLKLWSQEKFHQHMPNDDFKEFIIQVLVHLDILVESRHYRKEQESKVQSYLVPCIVKRRLPVTDFYVKSADKMICLSYTLLKSSIPAALSFKLIGAAINVWPLKVRQEGVCLYHQAAILCIDGSNELHLLVEDDKVFVYLINKDTKCFIPPNIASAVQECLTLTMTKVLEFYHKSFGKSLSTSEVSKAFAIEVGEWCTSGGGCYISVPEVKGKTEWLCKNNRTHQAKYPLYWIFEKKQLKCVSGCSGLDANNLALPPEDKHLFRLAKLITLDECSSYVIQLGLSSTTWKDIKQTEGCDNTVKKFLALCKWKDLKRTQMSKPSFKELSDILTKDYDTHFLCQLFMEDVTVYDIANSALQEIPEDNVLEVLSNEVGNCAIHLGVELGLSMAAIEGILFQYSKSMFKQTFGVMEKWKSSSKVRTTILMLMKAFQSADGRGLTFLIEKYGIKVKDHNNEVGEKMSDDGDGNL